MNISFAGCGFMGIYHVGVVSCLKKYAPNMFREICGASAGALAAVALLCDLPLGGITTDALFLSEDARTIRFGPFNPAFDVNGVLEARLQQILPPDAFLKCHGKLHISCTGVSTGENVIINEFSSNDELIQTLLCSSFIPGFSGLVPPMYRGMRYVDGCYSNNLPVLKDGTVTVSPFCGECDISPQDNSYSLYQINMANTIIEVSVKNVFRLLRVLFPPNPEVLRDTCKQGYTDTIAYLEKNGLIKCSHCSSVNPTTSLPRTGIETRCIDCRQKRDEMQMDGLPEAVLTILEEACVTMNRGFIHSFLQHRVIRTLSVRTLSVIRIPFVLPLNIAQAIFSRLYDALPKFNMELQRLLKNFINYVKNVLKKVNRTSGLYIANLSCQLAVIEFQCNSDDVKSAFQRSINSVSLPIEDNDETLQSCDGAVGNTSASATVNIDSQQSFPKLQGHNSVLCADNSKEISVKLADAIEAYNSIKVDSFNESFQDVVKVTSSYDDVIFYYYLDNINKETANIFEME